MLLEALRLGADDFLSKPINHEELVARIKILLQRKKLGNHSESRDSLPTLEIWDSHEKKTVEMAKVDHYRIEKMISWSASTMIYTVIDDRTGRRFVLKKLLRQVLEFPEVINRFLREIEIMKNIRHPNICQICESGEVKGCPYCIMEYICGDNLEVILNRSSSIQFSIIYKVAYGLAQALTKVHEVGIIHRDIKLNNVYLCNDGMIKLSDFGVAIKIGDTRLTQHGYAIGTPIYMAPEQFDGKRVTHVSDIYSYGAFLYHLITGQPPFTADNVTELVHKHHNELPVPINTFRHGVPQGWNNLVVSRCLAKKPEDRPQSMKEVLSYLSNIKT